MRSDVAELLAAATPRPVSARLAAAAKREAQGRMGIAGAATLGMLGLFVFALVAVGNLSGRVNAGIFAIIGFGLTFRGLGLRRRALALLRDGRLAEADIVSLETTQRELEYKPAYQVNLRLRGTDLRPVAIIRHQPEIVRFFEERHGANQPVYVLYDPAQPKKLLLPEIL